MTYLHNPPERPEPLVPAEIDLRGDGGFILDLGRIAASEFVARSSGDAFKAAFRLWCLAWQQVPASSLPDDDRVLAAWSGTGAAWPEVKAMVLSGFVLCRDGRLYHRTLSELALEAWQAKQKAAVRRAQSAERRHRSRQRQQARAGNADEARDTRGSSDAPGAAPEELPPSPDCPPAASPVPRPEHPAIPPTPAPFGGMRGRWQEGLARKLLSSPGSWEGLWPKPPNAASKPLSPRSSAMTSRLDRFPPAKVPKRHQIDHGRR